MMKRMTTRPLVPIIVSLTSVLACGSAETIRVERLTENPIIRPTMLSGEDGANINGPSLIRVPDWVPNKLGQYYLYFAHHQGHYIRLAYADSIAGPWIVHQPGTLRMENTVCDSIPRPDIVGYKHVASPDVHVDNVSREIRMYFHCPVFLGGDPDDAASYWQVTLVARSKDGLAFEANSEPLGNSYFRVFQWNEMYYALGMPGVFYRSQDGITQFEQGSTLFNDDMAFRRQSGWEHAPRVSHSGGRKSRTDSAVADRSRSGLDGLERE
jgi:hypothetical protein